MPEVTASPLDLASVIREGDRVMVSQGVCEPLGLVQALREQAANLPAVELFIGFSLSGLVDVDLARQVSVVSYGAMAGLGAVDAAGLLDVVPCNYSDLPGLIREGSLAADVLLLQVTPPDELGNCTTGISMDFTVDALAGARVIVAEINDQLPRHPGAAVVPLERLTLSTPVSRPVLSMPHGDPTELDLAIAAGVASLVPDGATLQLGFGSTVNAIGQLLTSRRGLRVHSALVGDWLLDLERAGALAPPDGQRPVIVTGAAMGSAELYRFVAEDPRVELRQIEGIQRPEVLATLDGLVAINSAIQVDVAGQVNVELIGARRVSALGGHTDFMRGAQASAGGRSIIALPSTAGRKRVSRIVKTLDSSWVSTQQSMVDHVVTEHGVADLRGVGLGRRRKALAAVADPERRSFLLPDSTPAPLPESVT
ncbi:acetyl-CoA hydrolase/transferase C-terminal domain-containing protein [Nocardioides sp. 31GB23]|uniref:acetyl-CoA hydrolase/transferase family protein n=1 Tax=Nocardioides sp. 31GB23 TaxID=3156065 RepID=UPI0032AF6DB7